MQTFLTVAAILGLTALFSYVNGVVPAAVCESGWSAHYDVE